MKLYDLGLFALLVMFGAGFIAGDAGGPDVPDCEEDTPADVVCIDRDANYVGE